MKIAKSLPFDFFQNLTWYLLITLCSIVLAFSSPALWWLPWLVSMGWGIGLLANRFVGPSDVPDKLQAYLNRALVYKAQINKAIKTTPGKHNQTRLRGLSLQIDDWVETIQKLVDRITSLRQNSIIWQDLAEAPGAIESLQTRLAHETDSRLKEQLAEALANRQKQVASLTALQNTVRQAEIQIESTLSMLGTIYSQLLTSQSTHDVADYTRLTTEVEEQVYLLGDHLAALREVKLGQREERVSR